MQGGASPKLRRSASLLNTALVDTPLPGTSVVNNLNLILGDKRQVAGLAWPDQAAGAAKTASAGPMTKRAPKRKKRSAKPEVAKSEALPPCRSLGHLIQMVSTPPSFANLFMASASTGELESSARSVGFAQLAAEGSGSSPAPAWPGRNESTLDAQDESATLPDELEPRTRRHESRGSSPLSFAGALSSASNSPRGQQASQPASPASPKQAPNSPKFGNASPKYSPDSTKFGGNAPKLGGSIPPQADAAAAGFGPGGSAPVSGAVAGVTCDAPVLSPRSPRMRRPSVKTRCSTRMAAKKSAKTLKVKRAARALADAPEPSTSAAGELTAEKPAKAPRKKQLARR